MSSKRDRGGGSFRDIRDRHLPMFDWDCEPPQNSRQTAKKMKPARRAWKRHGILHIADDIE